MPFSVELVVGVYCILIGTLIAIMWISLLLKGSVPELKTSPGSIYLHISAEILTAVLLLAGGIGAIFLSWGSLPLMLSLGMLLYTCINSAGYYVQSRALPMVAFFAALTLLTGISTITLFLT